MHSTPSMSFNQLTQVWFFFRGKDVWTNFPILVSLKQPVDSNQVATRAHAALGGAEELHASIMMLSKVVLFMAETQDLNPGVWGRKAAIPNSSDQMSVLLPAVASTDLALQSPHLCQLLGEWFSWEPINSQALFFQKGKKHRSQVTWSQIFDHTYLVSYSLSSRPDTSFWLTIAWPLNKFHSIVKGS